MWFDSSFVPEVAERKCRSLSRCYHDGLDSDTKEENAKCHEEALSTVGAIADVLEADFEVCAVQHNESVSFKGAF